MAFRYHLAFHFRVLDPDKLIDSTPPEVYNYWRAYYAIWPWGFHGQAILNAQTNQTVIGLTQKVDFDRVLMDISAIIRQNILYAKIDEYQDSASEEDRSDIMAEIEVLNGGRSI